MVASRRMRVLGTGLAGVLAIAIGGCGARSGVLSRAPRDAGAHDAPHPIDAAPPAIDATSSCPHDVLARSAFVRCGAEPRLGQRIEAPGVTCAEVCCAFGFSACVARATQMSFDPCNPDAPPPTGSCSDVYQPTWSSQCMCAP